MTETGRALIPAARRAVAASEEARNRGGTKWLRPERGGEAYEQTARAHQHAAEEAERCGDSCYGRGSDV